MSKKELCVCGGKCEGLCRKIHLRRKRDWTNPPNTCPAYYSVKNERN